MDKQITDFSMDSFSLAGKVAVVTGANQGLGLGYAYAFAKAGADLLIPHFSEDTQTLQKMVDGLKRKVVFIRGDLTDAAYRQRVIDTCMDTYGRIDILVNNAGCNHFEEFSTFPDDVWKRVIDLNLNALYYLGHAVAKIMIGQGYGKIINIGSALSFTADKQCPPYVASKHGVLGITRYFANELGAYNIQTNALCPGFFVSEVNQAVSSQKEIYEKIEKTDSRWPLGQRI